MKDDSLSVIVPALNEEKFLEGTINAVLEAVQNYFNQYEIIIFNDGSVDNTGYIANKIADRNKFIKVVHNDKPVCLGGIYNQGRKLAKMNYLILVNGKNDISFSELKKIFSCKGKPDMVIPYAVNSKERPLERRLFSELFVFLLNLLFKLDLNYYNHYVLHKRKIIDSIGINTDSYAFQAEALIKLIRLGHSYKQVGIRDNFSNDVCTKAFRIKNIIGVGFFLFRIFSEVYITGYAQRK